MRSLLAVLCFFLVMPPVFSQETTQSARRGPQPQVRYELGADSLPQDGVPKGNLEGPYLFHSKIIENTVRKYWVHVPAQYDPETPACVLVFQDGARAINPSGVIRVPEVLDNLIAKKQIPVTIGIFITPGQRGDDFPDSIGTGNPDNRDREYDVLDDKYGKMVIEEILPEVERQYRLTKDPVGRTIGGSSSGGICAFTVAWHFPHEFRNVISFIGSFTDIHGGHVYPQLVRDSEQKKDIRIFLQDGVNDNRSPNNLDRDWHLQNQRMVAALQDKNYDFAHVFGEGAHSDDHGGAILPEMLRWIWRDYPGIAATGEDLVAKAGAIKPVYVELFPGYDATASADPTGTWTWEQGFGRGRTQTNLLTLHKTADGRWAGTLVSDREAQDATTQELHDISLDGNKLTFAVQRAFNERVFTATYQGIVHSGKIAGWTMTEFNGTPRDREWAAIRQPTLADLVGTWRVEFVGPNGDAVKSKLTLRRAEDTIEGIYLSQYFGEAKAHDVRMEDGELKFTVAFSSDGNEFVVDYSAKPEGETLVGSLSAEYQGSTQESPFTAKREK